MKNYHGITERQHRIDPRQTALLNEQYEELKKELRPSCYDQDWMKGGGLLLWNPIAICETSNTSWWMGRLPMKDDSENQRTIISVWSNGQLSSDINTRSFKTSAMYKKVLPGIFLGCALIAERIRKEDNSDSGPGRIGDNERFRSSPSNDHHTRRIDHSEGRRTHILSSRWYSKIAW